ncbi:EAL domain-containing protein [Virgibacillus doumboii]|uniref:EAL domain-containing protein n=1 Tax=Virgibacillus doumboii TaxID=2697503 RepID=UPI0013DF04A6|nr:EAL domain-containing protein [Virgibacillus doumboii]
MNSNLDLSVRNISLDHVIQPIMNLTNNSVYGYEALLSSREFRNPELLFKYARERHQLIDVDIRSISKFFQTFKAFNPPVKDMKIFINVFPSTIIDSSFTALLQRLELSVDINPGNIVFELNEAEKETNLSKIKNAIEEIKKEGFLTALDDIGKGESSLKSLSEIEPDIVKVDKYFTENLAVSSKKQKTLQLFLNLFGGDTKVVVEGFESSEDLETARGLGVSFGQGFFLGKPKPIKNYIPGTYPDDFS